MGSESLINQKLGKYTIQGLLGEGGMGAVYRSEHPQLGIPVAIKVILNNADQEARQRFLREAQLAARLSHPNIIRIFDVDEQDGMPYLVMELIEGESLLDRLQKMGRMRLEDMLNIGIQLAEGLAYAHSHEMLHRDLKPANILIRANGTPVLVDFGLARLTNDSSGLTQSGMIVGTLAYMAPEQLQAQPLDARTDVYALGVVFFQMLTGRLPFEGDTAQVMFGHVYTAAPAPSTTGIALPQSIDSLIVAMMAKQAQGRPQSANEVVNVLRVIRQNPATAPRYVVYMGPTQQQVSPAMPPVPTPPLPQGGQSAPLHPSNQPPQFQGPPRQGPPSGGMPFQGPPTVGAHIPPGYQSGPMGMAPPAAKSNTGKIIGIALVALLALGMIIFAITQMGGGGDPTPTAQVAQSTRQPTSEAGGTPPTEKPGNSAPTPTSDDGPAPTTDSNGQVNLAGLTYRPASVGEVASGNFTLSAMSMRQSVSIVYAFGLIENTASTPRASLKLTLVLYDSNGTELLTENGYASVSYLKPGEKVGWQILISDMPGNASTYSIEVNSNEAEFELGFVERDIATSEVKLGESSLGVEITGNLTNNGSGETQFNQVIITLLGNNGQVLDVLTTFGDQDTLTPGETTRFSTSSFLVDHPEDVSDMLLFTEGNRK